MTRLVFWSLRRRKRLAFLAAKGLTARAIAPRLASAEHAPTPLSVRVAAERFGIRLLNRGDRPPKRPAKGMRAAGRRLE